MLKSFRCLCEKLSRVVECGGGDAGGEDRRRGDRVGVGRRVAARARPLRLRSAAAAVLLRAAVAAGRVGAKTAAAATDALARVRTAGVAATSRLYTASAHCG